TPALAARYDAAVTRRERREPLQHILGWEEFCGLRFTVTPDVLVPRPETEMLVEWTLSLLPRASARRRLAIDVGTGSGCIASALARPGRCARPRHRRWQSDSRDGWPHARGRTLDYFDAVRFGRDRAIHCGIFAVD